ncbi:hypothetical protein [Spirosoma panaciterrae]|uniref:hypothetical protein n=1 Tax=Spirosoma panaciterrae TaxID=496058 RepID=UPI00036D0325|nr:hypothetical protein [Spirosoma panaciterrae]
MTTVLSPISLAAEGPDTRSALYPLQPGLNKIGRRADAEQKPLLNEVLIDTNDVLIHRQYHCQIEVRHRTDGGGFDYVLSAYPGATNPTVLIADAAMPLHALDQVYLQPGAAFTLGSTTLRLQFDA